MDFQSNYNRNEFLKFLRNDFLGEKFEEHVEKTDIIKEFKSSFFTSITKLGVVEEFDNLIVLEIEHKSKNDARISLTKDIFKLLRQFELEGLVRQNALVILKNSDTQQYRFSLLTTTYNEDFEEKLSNPKRYSFLLGKGEKTKTPTEYLVKKGKVDSLETLISRFDVEVVRKEFFNDYLTLYIRLYKAITDDKEFVGLLKTQKVEIVSFTKNLLGKIVFLYFIQKKGWLGVEVDKEYGKDGDKNFMRSFWNNFKSDKKTVWENTGFFYNDYLEHLFYEGLNKDNRDDNDLSDYFDFKVPYLNGGLFKKDYEKWNKNESKIINDIFSNKTDSFEGDGILDIFDTYNFTIDEDDLYDSDIAIDPEMLGRIFEKMISISEDNIDEIIKIYDKKGKLEIGKELNKKFGAFYTPREIVHYMTKESIISYLVNNLKGNKEDKLKREEKETKIRTLFELKEKFLITKSEITDEIFEDLADIIEDIDDLLKKVKILDPAIGSGAFPMGILHEVSSIRYYIYGVFYKTFGMNSGEFLIPHPTPLLRGEGKKVVSMYKIKRDIIKNNIFGVDISSGAIDIARLRFWLSLVVEEETPEPLPNFEFKFVCANTLIPLAEEPGQAHLEFEKELKVETLRKYMGKYYNADSNKEKEEYRVLISKYLGFGKNITMDFGNKSERTKQLETYEPFNSNHSAEFFDPSLMMGNGKFDIVIGNPPYIKEYDNKNAFDGLRDKPYYMGKMDLWYYFACYGLDLLKDNGIESYIAQNNWITSFGAKKMRNKILEDAKIKEFIDFGDYKVFENVGIQTMIYILEKNKNNLNYEVKYSKLLDKNCKDINKFLYDNKTSEKYEKHYSKILKLDYIDKTIDFANKEKSIILDKILGNKNFILSEIDIAQGIIGGPDKAFIYKSSTMFLDNEKKYIHKYYTNVGKYYKEDSLKMISYLTKKNIDKIDNKITFSKNLELFKEKLLNRRECKTGQIKYFHLHWPRNESFFQKGKKIVCSTRVEKPSFYYTEEEFYGSRALNFIKTNRINLKYLTGLLNSKISYFWLKNKGKLLGNLLQIDKSHLISFPIKTGNQEIESKIIEKVDKILEITKQPFYDPKNPPKEQLDLEKEIDDMVYELYGLSEEEVKVVEESL